MENKMKGCFQQWYCTECGETWEGLGASTSAYIHGQTAHKTQVQMLTQPGSQKPQKVKKGSSNL